MQEQRGASYRGGLAAHAALRSSKFSKLCCRGYTLNTLKVVGPRPRSTLSNIASGPLGWRPRPPGMESSPIRCRPGPCQSVTGGPAASLENSSNRSFGLTPPTPNATISTGRALSTRFANKAGPQHKKVPQMAKPPARIGPDRGSLRARNRRYTWGVRLRPTSAQISLLPFATCQVLPWCKLRDAEPCAEEQRC